MSRTFRIRQRIKTLMMERDDLPTNVIFDHVNNTMTWGVTMQQLGNILSKDKDITTTGEVKKKGSVSGSYNIQTWSLTDEYKERNHDVSEDTLVENIHKWLSEQRPGTYVAKDIRKGIGSHVYLNSNVFRLACERAPAWLEIRGRANKGRIGVTYVVPPRSS